jgi:hypothetical protein
MKPWAIKSISVALGVCCNAYLAYVLFFQFLLWWPPGNLQGYGADLPFFFGKLDLLHGTAVHKIVVLAGFLAWPLLFAVPSSQLQERWWVALFAGVCEIVFARAFAFVNYQFILVDVAEEPRTFGFVRSRIEPSEWVYLPLLQLLEWGFGAWALLLHACIIAAVVTAATYYSYAGFRRYFWIRHEQIT